MYGSIEGVKDNLPRYAQFIKPDAEATGNLDIPYKTVTAYLTTFSAVVDNALAGTFQLPIQANGKTPEIINLIVDNLAAYKLASRFYSTLTAEENQSILALRKDANEILKALSSGEYAIPGAAKLGAAASSGDDELDQILAMRADDDEGVFDMEDPVSWHLKL